jgi:hypothetical protein
VSVFPHIVIKVGCVYFPAYRNQGRPCLFSRISTSSREIFFSEQFRYSRIFEKPRSLSLVSQQKSPLKVTICALSFVLRQRLLALEQWLNITGDNRMYAFFTELIS